jgi:cell division septal protein FtsQ
MAGDNRNLGEEVRALREELTHLRQHKMVMLYQSPLKVVFFRFCTGMAVGLGTVIGASALLSIIIWALSTIEFIPIIGEWSVMLADEIQTLMEVPEQ